MKALVLAAGKGEELNPLSLTRPKPMIPIVGKPILERVLLNLKENGIRDIIIVIGHLGEQIKTYFQKGKRLGLNITYVKQEQPGIEGAILAGKALLEGENHFLVVHGDIISDAGLVTRVLNSFENLGSDMALAAALQGKVQDFGVVSVDTDGFITKIYSQGEVGQGNYVVAGVFLVTPQIFEYLEKGVKFNQSFIRFKEDGGSVAAAIWPETWFDIGRPWDLIKANKYLLNQIRETKIHHSVNLSDVRIKGPVIIEEGVTLKEGATIRGPVYIGPHSYVGNNALIRDYTSLEHHSIVGMSVEIKNSLIFEKTIVNRLSYVGDSIIGGNTSLDAGVIIVSVHTPYKPITMEVKGVRRTVDLYKMGCVVGDNTRIGVNSTVTPGVKIGTGVVIHPNSTITQDVESFHEVITSTQQTVKKRE